MRLSTQLQFKLMAPEAQRAAIQRMALRGMNIDEIAERSGWTPDEVRQAVGRETVVPAWFAQHAKPAQAYHRPALRQ